MVICKRCDKPIKEHEAGRETDACVADVVMEFEVYADHGEYLEAGFPHAAEWGKGVIYPAFWWEDEPSGWAMSVLFYSTDMRESMRVVDKMHEKDFWFSMSYKSAVFPGDLETAGWQAVFRCVQAGIRGDHIGVSLDPKEAICRAALRAVIGLKAKEGKE